MLDLDCIGVEWGFRTRAFLEAHDAPYIISQPNEILDIVKAG